MSGSKYKSNSDVASTAKLARDKNGNKVKKIVDVTWSYNMNHSTNEEQRHNHLCH